MTSSRDNNGVPLGFIFCGSFAMALPSCVAVYLSLSPPCMCTPCIICTLRTPRSRFPLPAASASAVPHRLEASKSPALYTYILFPVNFFERRQYFQRLPILAVCKKLNVPFPLSTRTRPSNLPSEPKKMHPHPPKPTPFFVQRMPNDGWAAYGFRCSTTSSRSSASRTW